MRKLTLLITGLFSIFGLHAATVFLDFNTDPTASGLLTNYGSAVWVANDGAGAATNANDGYLQITSGAHQTGSIVFSDFDTGAVVRAFTFEADLRIGNGTQAPADGFSINYVRANDPVLAAVNGGNTPTGFATGPNCEANLPEEGTQTGISIGFDAWDSGGPPAGMDPCNVAPGSGITADIIGLDIRVDGTLVKQFPTTTQNGAVTDPTSIQTGPFDGTGNPDVLGWAHVKVVLDTNGVLNVTWKNRLILTNYQTTYFPSPGQLVFAGRCGDSWQNQHIDNISITTIPAEVALVNPATGLADGFSITINDSGASVVDTNQPISLTLNGTGVTPTGVSKSGAITTVVYHGFPKLLAVGSTNSVTVTAKDTHGNNVTGGSTFVVPAYNVIPASDAVASGVDTTKPGFRVLSWQSGNQPNRVYWTEEQIAGLHGANNANLTGATDGGYLDYNGVVNFNIHPSSAGGGEAGNFTTNNGYADMTFPGIPGANGLTGSSAEEFLVFLQFQSAGVYNMGVNSDDGFVVTEGRNPKDRLALQLGLFDGSRGPTDTIFTFAVTNAGIYPFRLLWFNGNGELPGNGAALEWFTVQNGVKILLNDPSVTNTTGIKAFYSGPALPAYVSQINPYIGQPDTRADRVLAQFTAGGTTVNQNSIKLTIDNVAVTPTFTSAGGVITATAGFGLNSLLSPGRHTAALAWSDSANTASSNAWSFTVAPYVTLNAGLSVPLSAIDVTQPGFTLEVTQLDPAIVNDSGDGLANQMDSMNALLAGLYFPWYGSNVVDTTVSTGDNGPAVTNNTWFWTNAIDFAVVNATGDFPLNFGMPGIPGVTSSSLNFASAFQSYIPFPTAGFYQMGVNSDDGFRLSEGIGVTRQVLHVSGPGIDTNVAAVVTSTNNSTFGGSLPVTPISAPAVFVGTNSCPNLPTTNLTGKIGVIDYNRCGSQNESMLAYNLQTNGAMAAILINQPSFGLPFVGGGTPPGPVTIPVLIVNGFGGQRDFWITNANLTASIGADANLEVGVADAGKGMSHVDFGFVVPSAGAYPFRLLYEQGGGDAGCEWTLLVPSVVVDSGRVLLNDSSTNASPLAYRAVTIVPRPTISVSRSGELITITYSGTLQSSATANGNYQDVPNAPNPYTVSTTAASMGFYRARN